MIVDIKSVVGVHTYMGLILQGLTRNNLHVAGSYETWDLAMPAASSMGGNVIPLKYSVAKPLIADMTIGNPPCSRFSPMSSSMFKGKDPGFYNNLDLFVDLRQVLEVTIANKSKVMWWETGPLAWSSGTSFVEQIHQQLADLWGVCTTLIIRLDLLWLGVPQNRPRVHIIHMATDVPPPPAPGSLWKSVGSVGEYIKKKVAGRELKTPIFTREGMTAHEYVTDARARAKFNSTKPLVIGEDDNFTPSVVSGRFWAWRDDNRFWDLLEYASLMGADLDKFEDVLATGLSPQTALGLLSKGVSADASSFIYSNILRPWAAGEEVVNAIHPRMTDTSGIYKLDLKQQGIVGKRVAKRSAE